MFYQTIMMAQMLIINMFRRRTVLGRALLRWVANSETRQRKKMETIDSKPTVQLRLIALPIPFDRVLGTHHKSKMATNQRTPMDTRKKKYLKQFTPKTKKMKIRRNRRRPSRILIHLNSKLDTQHILTRKTYWFLSSLRTMLEIQIDKILLNPPQMTWIWPMSIQSKRKMLQPNFLSSKKTPTALSNHKNRYLNRHRRRLC
mmetsp:Transcript_7052/g.17226  ORF Transcript_7052/g.17226 Transcript_7052/m.17226 type:complete len:201 (+) Transcript_7052:646-1248(+)